MQRLYLELKHSNCACLCTTQAIRVSVFCVRGTITVLVCLCSAQYVLHSQATKVSVCGVFSSSSTGVGVS